MSAGSMEKLNEFPPTIWCVWGDGTMPGLTMGSDRSITNWEQPKRRDSPCAETWLAARTAKVRVLSKVMMACT